jgi:4-hydroxybenzoate polyprenyltransferase
MVGALRLVHPFPSALDAVATAVLAVIAGGSGAAVATLAAAMLALQLSIGAANDVVDAPRDAASRPTKPIPAGLVPARAAVAFAIGSAVLGLALSATRGPATLALAGAGLCVGLAYDLRLKATPWSWLPFAAGIPLIPLFAWVGAAGAVPPAVLLLVLLAAPAGAGLAVANALPDEPGDRAGGTRTVATALGPRAAWWTATLLLVGTYVVAVATLIAAGAGPAGGAWGTGAAPGDAIPGASTASWALIVVAGLLLALGAWLGRGPAPARRRAGWGVQGVAVVALAAGWVGVLAAAGRL